MSTELKTKPTGKSVDAFLRTVQDQQKREDCFRLVGIMKEVTGSEPQMWGESIVGFGTYRYKYGSGREGEWLATGFSPRKQNLTVYIMAGFDGYGDLLKHLGEHSVGKSCLYFKRLSDLDEPTLKRLVRQSIEHTKKLFP